MARESNLGERYLQKIGELREVLLQLLGLGSVVGSHDKFYHDIPSYAEFAIEFPNFGLPALVGEELTITASEEELEKALDGVLACLSGLLPPCRYDSVRPSMAWRSRTAARRAIAMISIWSQG
jgi:hypothetical protein